MVFLLTLGETLGVAATPVGNPLATAETLHLSTAGAESTVGIGMCRLGHQAAWVGAIGDDEIGRRVQRDLAAEGVDTRFVRIVPDVPTGFMIRDRRTPDLVTVSYYRAHGAGSKLHPDDVTRAFSSLDTVDILHITGITPALSETCSAAVTHAVKLARQRGAAVSLDVNYRAQLLRSHHASSDIQELARNADIVFLGEDELHLLSDQQEPELVAKDVLDAGPSEVVVKLGASGAMVTTASGDVHHIEGLKVTKVDVIGAGDSFVAGYLAARSFELPISQRLSWATICAACTVGTHGDWEGLPRRHEIAERAALEVTRR